MSYEIVKAIKIDTNKHEVWLKSDSNNVSPRHYTWWHCESLSKILCAYGKKEVEKEILKQYWSGNFQRTNNLYEKSVMYYKNKIPQTWDNVGSEVGKEEFGKEIEYTHKELKTVLYEKYLAYKNRKKGVFYVKDGGYFVRRRSGRWILRTGSTARAKRFNSREDAELYARNIRWNGNLQEMVVSA